MRLYSWNSAGAKGTQSISVTASLGLWYWLGSFICMLFLVTQKLLILLVVFILCGTLLEPPFILVDIISWHAQPFAPIKNLCFCTKEVTK